MITQALRSRWIVAYSRERRNLPSVRPGRDGSPQYRAAAIFSLAKPFAARYAKK
jgi:hypothetical protein